MKTRQTRELSIVFETAAVIIWSNTTTTLSLTQMQSYSNLDIRHISSVERERERETRRRIHLGAASRTYRKEVEHTNEAGHPCWAAVRHLIILRRGIEHVPSSPKYRAHLLLPSFFHCHFIFDVRRRNGQMSTHIFTC